MPTNPMQKKARNAFLLGMIITFIVCAIIGGLCYYSISNKNKAKEQEEGSFTYAYRLKRDIKALNEITVADVEAVTVSAKAVPAGSFPSKTKTTNAKGKEEWISCGFPSGKYAKVALRAGTILGESLVVDSNSSNVVIDEDGNASYVNDLRRVEYSMLVLPTEVDIGDFVDIRITFPNGQDLIVVPKKEIKTILGNTVGFDMSEAEIELMDSAIVESYVVSASKLYVTQYLDPGTQKAMLKSYTPTDAVRALMEKNSSIIADAYKNFDTNVRSFIDLEKSAYATQAGQNIEKGIQEEIQNAQKAREAYLSGLTSY